MLDQSDGLYFNKDKHSRYTNISQFYAHGLGFKNPKFMLGRTDYDSHCAVSSLADILIREDQQVMAQCENMTFIKALLFKDSSTLSLFLLEKKPLIKNGSVEGVIGVGIELPHYHPLLQLVSSLCYRQLKNSEQFSFRLTPTAGHKNTFTNRELECLFYVSRAMTAKEIAGRLKISPKTVESHIENMKNKLGVTTKSQLVEKYFAEGYQQIISV